LIIFVFVTPLITLCVTYSLNHVEDHEDQTIPFISGSIDYSPEANIGSLGLTLTAGFVGIALFVKSWHSQAIIIVQQRDLSKKTVNLLYNLNRAAFVTGFLSVLGLIAVCSFQYHLQQWAHLSFALVLFVSTVVHLCLVSRLDTYLLAEQRPKLVRFRIVSAVLGVIFIIPMVLTFVFPNERRQNASAVFEILSASNFFVFFLSYIDEFRRVSVQIEVQDPLFHTVAGQINSEEVVDPSTESPRSTAKTHTILDERSPLL